MEPKEKLIKETIESIDGISRANANPFLYDKIINRMNSKAGSNVLKPATIGWAMAFMVVLIGLNILTITHYNKSGSSQADGSSLVSKEYFSYLNNY
ncbi:MAG TPA: hypothetical protein VN922_09355 [Bacteroidia bacterium]|nr:hypothetical protein [Bacteroidia bacterium]